MDRDELLRLLRAFETAQLEYVLIGATAMAFHGIVRATEAVDLLVRATPENLARARDALRAVYPGDSSIDDIRDADLLGDYPSVRFYPQSSGKRRAMTRSKPSSRMSKGSGSESPLRLRSTD